MALLTTGDFYYVTFLATTDAAWIPYRALQGGITGALGTAIFAAVPASLPIYVIDASTGLFAYLGGQAFGFDDALLNGAATPIVDFTLTATDGTPQYWANDGTGNRYQYDAQAGVLRTFAGVDVAAFKAFL